MYDVQIIEQKTGRLVATIPVQIGAMNYTPTVREYEKIAWECAVDDGSVDPTRKDDYMFKNAG